MINLTLPASWQSHLDISNYVLGKFLETEYAIHTIYPPKHLIFKALELVSYDQVKVVIIGQDPYHQSSQATGLAFAVPDEIYPKPPSLRRILDEVERDCLCKIDRNHSSLIGWANQGVLLLNTILTVRASSPLSHSRKGWEVFTDNILQTLSKHPDPIVFLLWGSRAQSKQHLIIGPNHFILTAPHPSPLARGFIGCSHFSETNRILTSIGKTPIDWSRVQL